MRQEHTQIHRCSLINDTANTDIKKQTCGGFFLFLFKSPDECDSRLFVDRFPLLKSNFS